METARFVQPSRSPSSACVSPAALRHRATLQATSWLAVIRLGSVAVNASRAATHRAVMNGNSDPGDDVYASDPPLN